MNFYAADQLARERQLELTRLAEAERAARLARRVSRRERPAGGWPSAGASSPPAWPSSSRRRAGPPPSRRCKLEG